MDNNPKLLDEEGKTHPLFSAVDFLENGLCHFERFDSTSTRHRLSA